MASLAIPNSSSASLSLSGTLYIPGGYSPDLVQGKPKYSRQRWGAGFFYWQGAAVYLNRYPLSNVLVKPLYRSFGDGHFYPLFVYQIPVYNLLGKQEDFPGIEL